MQPPSRQRLVTLQFMALTMAMTMAACGSLGDPYLGSFPTSSVPDENPDQTPVGSSEKNGISGDPQSTAFPPRPADYIPAILVVTDGGVAVVERNPGIGLERFESAQLLGLPMADFGTADGSTPPTTTDNAAGVQDGFPIDELAAEPVDSSNYLIAKDDLFGGIVAQNIAGSVVWFPGTGGDPRVVGVEGVDLVEIGYSTGTPEAITEGNGQILRTRLVDNESIVFADLEPGEQLVDLSSAGGVVAVAVSDSGCGRVRFYSAEGVELAISPFSQLLCSQIARPNVGAVAMSPDGEAVAYTVVSYREDGVERSTQLRAVELASGAPIIAVEVGGSGDAIVSLAFDGVSAAMLRRSSANSEVVLFDGTEPLALDLGAIGTPRSVSFARLPLSPSLMTKAAPPSTISTEVDSTEGSGS